MATINYTGPDGELEGLLHLFDLEFELTSGATGRATSVSDTVENAVSMTEQGLFDGGYSINNSDVYDVAYVNIGLNYVDPTNSYRSVIVGVTTVSG